MQAVSAGNKMQTSQACSRHAPQNKLSSRRPVQPANVRSCAAVAERPRLSDVSCCNMPELHVLSALYRGLDKVKRSSAVRRASSRGGTRSASKASNVVGSACNQAYKYLGSHAYTDRSVEAAPSGM